MDCYGAVNLRLEVTVWLAADFTFPPDLAFLSSDRNFHIDCDGAGLQIAVSLCPDWG
jgi:hypothetical protein